jgi:hypothetical protein
VRRTYWRDRLGLWIETLAALWMLTVLWFMAWILNVRPEDR